MPTATEKPYHDLRWTYASHPFGAPDSQTFIDILKFYFEPEGVQLLGSPAEQTPMEPHDVRHEEVDVAIAIERIQKATTLEIRSIQRAWAGLRTFTPDRFPVVGPDPDHPSFVWLAGQGGFGIMTSPGMASIATSLIIDRDMPPSLVAAGIEAAPLLPDRFRA